jgi:uncharacterized protein
MNRVFVDTYYYLAAMNPADGGHERAADFAARYRGESVTTQFVLIEVANSFSRREARPLFLSLLRSLEKDPNVTILPAEATLFAEGLAIFAARPDKNWSLTDCISFAVMRSHGLTEALTHDHHFEQAGFKALMK